MKNKLRSYENTSIKHNSEELPPELFELSEEDLQQIVGGTRPLRDVLREMMNIQHAQMEELRKMMAAIPM